MSTVCIIPMPIQEDHSPVASILCPVSTHRDAYKDYKLYELTIRYLVSQQDIGNYAGAQISLSLYHGGNLSTRIPPAQILLPIQQICTFTLELERVPCSILNILNSPDD